jgi:hypothetical protein
MIGREGEVRAFEMIRWARHQARAQHLRPLEAHVLLLLATYANTANCTAWPSLRTLALDSGLKPTSDGRNSAVSAALSRLEELQLVWTCQGGHGRPARRELLFNPAVHVAAKPSREPAATPVQPPLMNPLPSGLPEGQDQEPSAHAEGTSGPGTDEPSGLPEVQPSGLPEENVPGERPGPSTALKGRELPTATSRGSLPASRKASPPESSDLGTAGAPSPSSAEARAAILASLAEGQRRRAAARDRSAA